MMMRHVALATRSTMGHACTKDHNAEKLEQRRFERERRLGLIRQSAQPVPSATLVPNGMWPKERSQSAASFYPAPRYPMPHVSNTFAVQQPRAKTPDRRAILPNPNSPFSDWRPLHAARPETNRNERLYHETTTARLRDDAAPLSEIKPVVLQALNQLCAIELQQRMHVVSEEVSACNDLMREFERIQELEALRAASRELIALEHRSRLSVLRQEEFEFEKLARWISELLEEARLASIIRLTLDRQQQSLPSSRRSSPVRPRANENFTVRLGWIPDEPQRSLTHQPHASPKRVNSHEYSSGNNTPHQAVFRERSRDEYTRLTELTDRLVSEEEEALTSKIARQRGLIESTRSTFRYDGRSAQAPNRVAPRLQEPELPSRHAPMLNSPLRALSPTVHYDPRDTRTSAAVREASIQATRNRLSALSHYQ